MTTYFKVLREDGTCYHGGHGKWNLPKRKRAGKWMPELSGPIICCQRGYHLVTAKQLIDWLGPAIFIAEGRGDTDVQSDKTAFRQARLTRQLSTWNERTARLFACDLAEHVLYLYEKAHPSDLRPRTAIEVTRKFANGEATDSERDAARDVAWDVARDVAWDVAWAAARDAAWDAARAAAWDAARDVAWDAARDAAWDAARDAERAWQVQRLCEILGIRED